MPRSARSVGAGTVDKITVPDSRGLMLDILLMVKHIQANMATKADLRAATKTILRGEDVTTAKPGPRLTPTKQLQIEAVEKYRATHRGCSLFNACMRSYIPAKGGYKNPKVIYEHIRRQTQHCQVPLINRINY